MPVYQGKKVTVVRPAKQGDQGFDPNTPKSVIKLPDGTEKTVPAAEISEE
jgi:hypothetical protein